jgi:hypothetical protein
MALSFSGHEGDGPPSRPFPSFPWQTEVSTKGTDLINSVLNRLRCSNPLKKASVLATVNNLVRTEGKTYLDIAKEIETLGVDEFLKISRDSDAQPLPLTTTVPIITAGELLSDIQEMRREVSAAFRCAKRNSQVAITTEGSDDDGKQKR